MENRHEKNHREGNMTETEDRETSGQTHRMKGPGCPALAHTQTHLELADCAESCILRLGLGGQHLEARVGSRVLGVPGPGSLG